ncbi:MAG: alanine racemase [Pseudomonadota bacterium]
MSRNTTATIDVSALAHNVERIRALTPDSRLMAVVKADAYGHGLERCLPALAQADLLAVATLNEARSIRALDQQVSILLLEGVMQADEIRAMHDLRLECVIHHARQLVWIESAGIAPGSRVWLKIDSGMHRLGFGLNQVSEVYARIQRWPGVQEIVLMSHFACADQADHDLNAKQLQAFDAAVADLQAAHCLANSAALLNFPDTHRQWVRPGLMLYGISPLVDRIGADHGLRPVMQLDSQLIAVKDIPAGETIGYGARYTASRDMRMGVIAIGYGDGYPRSTPDGTPILVNGRTAPLVGCVSMDMTTVDLTDQPEARVGDPVTLWGRDLPVERIARHVGTIPYELVCRVTQRVRYEEISYLRNKPRS